MAKKLGSRVCLYNRTVSTGIDNTHLPLNSMSVLNSDSNVTKKQEKQKNNIRRILFSFGR